MKIWRGSMIMLGSNVVGILLALLIAIGSWAIWGKDSVRSPTGVIALAGASVAIVCGVNLLVFRYKFLLPLHALYRRCEDPTRTERSNVAPAVQEIALLEDALNAQFTHRHELLRAGQKFLEDGTLPGFPASAGDDASEQLVLRFIQTLELAKAYVEVLIDGHLYLDIPEDIRKTGMGQALRTMTTELRTIITEIRKETTRLSMSSARVAALSQRGSRNATTETQAVENISTSIHQVAGNLREVLQNITRQAGSLDETFADIQDLLTSTERINTNVEMLSASAEATSRSIHEIHEFMQEIDTHAHSLAKISATVAAEAGDGGKAMGKVIDGIHTIKETVEEAAIAIRRLGEDSKHIDEIVEVINKVAEQTNLLALNAAIIAAQAGERGRGFSVVADEIKELSERTRTSTQEISQIIRSLQAGVEQGTVAMQRCLQAVGDGVDLSNQSGDILQKIVLSIQGAQEMAGNLAEATVKQTQNSQQVHHATEQIMQKIEELSATALKQTEDNTHLAEMANILKDVTQQIELSATTQLQASDAIVLSIEEIQDMVQRNAKIAHELAASSEELAALESNLAESMGNFLITPPPLPAEFDETCPTVVFIFPGAPSFYNYIYKGIKKIFAPPAFQSLAMDAQNDAILQAEYANWSLRQKWLKGIILCAFDEQTGGRIVLDARAAGIPVVVADRTSQHAMLSVFSNNQQGGEFAAEILREKLPDDQSQTVLACGPRNIPSIFNRMEGFFSKARSYGWKVGEVFTSIMNIEEAQQGILEGLRMQPDTKGLFLTNEHASLAYLELLQNGKLTGRNLYAVCYDLNTEIAQAIRDSRILGALFQDPEQIGQVAAQALLDQLQPSAKQPTAPQELFVPVKKITRENLPSFLSFVNNNNHQKE